MSVVSVKELAIDSGDRSADSSLSERSARRSFWVQTDNVADLSVTVENAPGIPAYGSSHPGDPGRFVSNPHATPRGTKNDWTVDVDYSTKADPAITPSADPFAGPLKVSIAFTTTAEPMVRGYDGVPVVNTAGQPFEPPPTIERTRGEFRVVHNEPDPLNYFTLLKYNDIVNEVPKFGFPIGTLKLNVAGAERQVSGGTVFWAVTYRLQVNYDGWSEDVVSMGYEFLDGGSLVSFIDSDGRKLTTPSILNSAGEPGSKFDFGLVGLFRYPPSPFPAWMPA